MEENQSSQGLIEVHVKMRRISIGNNLINKANTFLWWALAKLLLAY